MKNQNHRTLFHSPPVIFAAGAHDLIAFFSARIPPAFYDALGHDTTTKKSTYTPPIHELPFISHFAALIALRRPTFHFSLILILNGTERGR